MTIPLRLDKIEKAFIRFERNAQLHSYALEIIAELRSLREESAGNQQLLAMQKDVIQQLQQEHERITKERDALQESYDDAEMRAADAIAERNDEQTTVQQLREELEQVKEMFDKSYRRNVDANVKIGEHLKTIESLRSERDEWEKAYGRKSLRCVEAEAAAEYLRSKLAEKDKVLEAFADQSNWHKDYSTELVAWIGGGGDPWEKAGSILSQYATKERETGKHDIDSDQPWIYSEKGICNCLDCKNRRWEDKTICSACGHPLSDVCACDDL